jgi:hypothetical protein
MCQVLETQIVKKASMVSILSDLTICLVATYKKTKMWLTFIGHLL